MKFSEIKKFPRCNYQITVNWKSLQFQIDWMKKDYNADFDPDFQRGHVWSEKQQIEYCEYILRGGASGKDIYCNCPNWEGFVTSEEKFTLVDGKQRIRAVQNFLNDKIRVFDCFYSEYEGYLRGADCFFVWHVAAIKSRRELLEWYLNFNSGGSVHSKEELDRVRELIKNEK